MVAVRFVLGRAGTGKTHHCLSAIRGALREQLVGSPSLILLVPEQAALQMERLLLGGGALPGLGRCEVLSFRRLAHRVLNAAGGALPVVLSPIGREMVLRDLLARHRKDLREFDGVALRPGFVAGLGRAIVELLQESVSPERLLERAEACRVEGHPSADRLHDVAAMYARYMQFLGSERVDPEGVLDLSRRHLDRAAWLSCCRLWVDGFAGFTGAQVRLLVELCRRAAEATISFLVDPARTAVMRSGQAVDPVELFARTERTACALRDALRAASIELESPTLLEPAHPPRFRTTPLIRLEAGLFGRGHATAEPKSDAVRFIAAADRRAESRAVAAEIRRLVREPGDALRYRDIAIIVRDLGPYHDLLSVALSEHGVPFFIDRRRPTRHHPLVEAVRALLRLRGGKPGRAAALPLLVKTGLTPLDDAAADLLENYQLLHGLDDVAAWTAGDWAYPPFDAEPDGRVSPSQASALERVNAARRTLVASLGAWWSDDAAEQPAACRELARGLIEALSRLGAPSKLEEWSRAAAAAGDLDRAQEHTQVWTDLAELLDELVGALGDTAMPMAEFREVIEAGLADFSLGLVPPTLDQVLVSSIERSRHPPVRAAFVMGFSDGEFPHLHRGAELLDDAEREWLERGGMKLGPGRRARLLDERMLAYIAATRPSERLWVSYPAADDQGRALQPSPYLADCLSALGWEQSSIASRRAEANPRRLAEASTEPQLAAGLVVALRALAERPSSPVEDAGAWLGVYEEVRAGRLPGVAKALRGLAPARQAALSAEAIRALHDRSLATSVTRLESFAACPFQHFAKYELRLSPRRVHEVGALHWGRLYHVMMEEFVNLLAYNGESLADLEEQQIADRLGQIADSAVKALDSTSPLDSAAKKILRARGPRDLAAPIQSQKLRARPGLKPWFTERSFGLDVPGALPALTLKTPKGRTVRLRGRIDRLDLIAHRDETLAVVFDYKRSDRNRLRLDEAMHGLALQLLAYLLVLKDHGCGAAGGTVRPVGAFYLPLVTPFQSVEHPSEAKEPLRLFMPRGILDFDALAALEPSLKEGPSQLYSARINKDGGSGKSSHLDTASRPVFEKILAAVRQKLGELADRIIDGDIRVAPVVYRDRLPCEQCDFRAVCRFEYSSGFAVRLPAIERGDMLKRFGETGTDDRA